MITRLKNLVSALKYKYLIDKRVNIGANCILLREGTFIVGNNPQASISIKDNVYIGKNFDLHTNSKISIGNYSVLSDYVYISTLAHGLEPGTVPIMQQADTDKGNVIIGENCFIGHGAKILPGVVLGDWCVVGAGAVVTKSYSAYSMLVGNPAKCIKIFDSATGKWCNAE